MATFDFGPYGTNAPDDQWELAQLMSGQYNRAELEKILEGLRNKPTPPVNMMKGRHPGVTPPAPPVQSGPNPQGGLMPVNAPPPTVLPQATSVPPQRTQGMERIQELENYQPGYFEQNAPWIMGLLGGASGLLEAMGPSRMPVSGGQIFARGLQSGLSGYLGGSQFQSQARKGRQSELKNLLDSETFQLNWEAAQDKKQNRENLRQAIPGMVESLQEIGDLSEHEIRRIRMAQQLAPSNPETAFATLDEIAKRTNKYNFLNLGDGQIVRADKVTGEHQLISGDVEGFKKDPFEGKGMEVQLANVRYQELIAEGKTEEEAKRIIKDEWVARKNLQGTYRFQAPIDVSDPTLGTQTMMMDQSGNATPVPGSQIRKLKTLPVGATRDFDELDDVIFKIDEALRLLDDPQAREAIGRWDALFPAEAQTKEGIQLRGMIAEIGSAILLERSGAAVTATEFARAKPFLPLINDPEKKTRANLESMKILFTKGRDRIAAHFNPKKGYLDITEGTSVESKPKKRQTTKELEAKFPELEKVTVEITEEKTEKPWWIRDRGMK